MRIADCLGIALTLVLLPASSQAYGKAGDLSAKDEAEVRSLDKAYAEAWLNNDAEAVMRIFTGDAVLIPQGNRPVEGIEAIKRFWWPPNGPKTTIKSFSITTDEVGGNRDLAYVRGSFKFSFSYEENGTTRDLTSAGNYIMLLKRQSDGSWRVSHRMWGDLPRS